MLAVGHDDAIVVLGMLQIVLCKDAVAGRLCIAGKRQIFFSDMRRRAADFYIWSVGLKAARKRILTFAAGIGRMAGVAVAVVVAAATATVLLMLTWPHWRLSS